jgi:hypothetical protein
MASQSLMNQLSQSFYKADGTPNDRLDKYCTKEIKKIIIDGNEFEGYKAYSFFWEKTYAKEPERSASGNIGNLDSYPTFITPHLQINFSMLSIADYRRLYELILSRNEFEVTCYDPTDRNNSTTTNKMYFYPDSLPKLNMISRIVQMADMKEKWVELLGVQDYTVEMVGTNNDIETQFTINYHRNPPMSGINNDVIQKIVNKGSEVLVGQGAETIMDATYGDYKFRKWCTVQNPSNIDKGINYLAGNKLFAYKNIDLYAQWGG